MGGSSSKPKDRGSKPEKYKDTKETRKQSVDVQGRVTPVAPKKDTPSEAAPSAAGPATAPPATASSAPPAAVVPPLPGQAQAGGGCSVKSGPTSLGSGDNNSLREKSDGSQDSADREFDAIASELIGDVQGSWRTSRKQLFAGNGSSAAGAAGAPVPPTACTLATSTTATGAAPSDEGYHTRPELRISTTNLETGRDSVHSTIGPEWSPNGGAGAGSSLARWCAGSTPLSHAESSGCYSGGEGPSTDGTTDASTPVSQGSPDAPSAGSASPSLSTGPAKVASPPRQMPPGASMGGSRGSGSTCGGGGGAAAAVHHLAAVEPAAILAEPMSWQRGQLLGSGSFGKVYFGLNTRTGELLAIKQIEYGGMGPSDSAVNTAHALQREVCCLQALSHPNIVRYMGVERDDVRGTVSIFLEYCAGGSIASLLEKFGAFQEALARTYIRMVLEGLAYLHARQIMHRDIKGANVLVDAEGVCKLADFGASKILQHDLMSNDGNRSLRGTPYWMAPEVIKQTGHSFPADVWSVACVLVEMLTGQPPWSHFSSQISALFHIASSKAPPPLPQGISPSAVDFLLLAFRRNPRERPGASYLLTHAFVRDDVKSQAQQRERARSGAPISQVVAQAEGGDPQAYAVSGKDVFFASHRAPAGHGVAGSRVQEVGARGASQPPPDGTYSRSRQHGCGLVSEVGSSSAVPYVPSGGYAGRTAGGVAAAQQKQQQQPQPQQPPPPPQPSPSPQSRSPEAEAVAQAVERSASPPLRAAMAGSGVQDRVGRDGSPQPNFLTTRLPLKPTRVPTAGVAAGAGGAAIVGTAPPPHPTSPVGAGV